MFHNTKTTYGEVNLEQITSNSSQVKQHYVYFPQLKKLHQHPLFLNCITNTTLACKQKGKRTNMDYEEDSTMISKPNVYSLNQSFTLPFSLQFYRCPLFFFQILIKSLIYFYSLGSQQFLLSFSPLTICAFTMTNQHGTR